MAMATTPLPRKDWLGQFNGFNIVGIDSKKNLHCQTLPDPLSNFCIGAFARI